VIDVSDGGVIAARALHLYGVEAVAVVGLYKLNPVYPQLESTWILQPLNLKFDLLVSKFAFKCNLYRYTAGGNGGITADGLGGAVQVESS
jgi:hypothetical protein